MSLDRTLPARQPTLQPDAPEGPKSPAWIAAEHAFAPRQPALPAATAAVVTVKRRRAVVGQSEALAGDRGAASAPSSDALEPRVFRLPSARSDAPAQAVERGGPLTPPARKRRPDAAVRRPGPVAHIVVQTPAPQAAPVLSTRVLAERLAEVAPILDAIRIARSFRFTAEGSQAEWQRLSRAADRLLEQIALRT